MKLGVLGALITGAALCAAPAFAQDIKPVEKKDPAFDELVAPGAKLELLVTGYGFTEGVTWVP